MKWFNHLFGWEEEFTKRWMARFTRVVFILLFFYLFLSQELLYFHFTRGLSYKMCKMLYDNYTKLAVVCITAYAVTFVGSMAKAYLAKRNESNNDLAFNLAELGLDGDEDESDVDVDVDTDVEDEDE